MSDPQPLAINKAFRNRDWTVLIICTVSTLIKVLIGVSTGLITLSWIKVHLNSYPMMLQVAFSNNSAGRLSETKTTSYYIMQGLVDKNLNYPDGVSKDYAFQSATANLPDSAETRVTVDGLTNDLNCVPVDRGILGADFYASDDGSISISSLNITITSPGCNIKAQPIQIPELFLRQGYEHSVLSNGLIARLTKVQYDGTEDD